MKKKLIILLFLCFCSLLKMQAQDTITILDQTEIIPPIVLEEVKTDTLVTISEEELPDLHSRLMELNKEYTVPMKMTDRLLQFSQKDELQMSPEAQYIIATFHDRSNQFDESVTFKDTVIVNRLFMPLVFKGNCLPEDLTFYDKNTLDPVYTPDPLYKSDNSLFADYIREKKWTDTIQSYMESQYPARFRYSQHILPKETVKAKVMKKEITQNFPLVVKSEVSFEDVEAPAKFIPERRYWTSHFESSVQFAQNYVSPNWHKGGNSSLNLNNREYLIYDYNKDRIKLTNELEIKNNVYTAPNDTLRNYKVSDDVFRLHSNFGYQAFYQWYYTFDMEFKTQLLSSYEENQNVKQAGFLAPFSLNVGLGMKYDLNKTFEKKNKSLTFNVNIAPLSYTFRKTIDEDIKLDKHFQAKKDGTYPASENLFGSTINATLNFQFNRNVSWYSRFYYNTSYKRIEGEWENRFTFAWSRYFSTNITVNMRYDDGVAKNPEFDRYLQINELLSFGFNYKW